MRFLTCGSSALLIELDNLNQTLTLLNLLQQNPLKGITELVPAAQTILLQFKPHLISVNEIQNLLKNYDLSQIHKSDNKTQTVVIPAIYKAQDLKNVAQMLQISTDELIAEHTKTKWQAAFLGFAPGFAYLTSDNSLFNKIKRHQTPRTLVPAGSIALADNFSAIYPQESPGGWQLIGTTNLKMWDEMRQTPSLLKPGDYVQFQEEAKFSGYKIATKENLTNDDQNLITPTPANALQIKKIGLLTICQDLGRFGHKNQGVGTSGAMDQGACIAANQIVGNDANSAVLENIGAGLTLQSIGNTTIALTGADIELTLTDQKGNSWFEPSYKAIALNDGEQISISKVKAGLRSYLAVRGGFACSKILSSVSYDSLAKIGTKPMANGQILAIKNTLIKTPVKLTAIKPINLPQEKQVVELDIILGPRCDWFNAASVQLLSTQQWQVTPQSNRIGLRLAGAKSLERTITKELPSEGLVCGSVQIPASGQPIIFLRDHPLTGGYPVIACLAKHHLDLAGQIPCGAYIRFNIVNP